MITLLTSYYNEENTMRHKKLRRCLEKSLYCNFIDRVVVFAELGLKPSADNRKMIIESIGHRPTYNDFFAFTRKSDLSASDVTVISNSDIFFDGSLLALGRSLKTDQCAALSRWDITPSAGPVLFDRNDSQDVWVFRGPLKKIQEDFSVVVPRCDKLMFSNAENNNAYHIN
jgi:hypothetical protein